MRQVLMSREAMIRKPWIDYFRIIAAFLIVAIHTAPLASFSETADYLFTYCFSRIGVPFFFMVTGYFVLGPAAKPGHNAGSRLIKSVRRTSLLYAGASLLYLPVSLYAGHLLDLSGMGDIFKAVVFDGTFYHLWYLPASITGLLLVYALLTGVGMKKAACIAGLLYVIGLGGDTYYGLVNQIPAIKSFYNVIFYFSTYTRNGIFYAPVFLLLGAAAYGLECRRKPGRSFILSAVFMVFMLVEGGITRYYGLQRHNSMYLLLVPAMFFLFEGLRGMPGKEVSWLHHLPALSLWIYLLHPLGIIAVRLVAKVTGQTAILVDQSFIHYLAVCLATAMASGTVLFMQLKIKGVRKGRIQCTKKDVHG